MDAKKIGIASVLAAVIAAAALFYPFSSQDDNERNAILSQETTAQPFARPATDSKSSDVEATIPTSVDKDCKEVPYYSSSEEGVFTMDWRCATPQLEYAHPYTTYTSATLGTMIYGDAEAAEILGLRLRERDSKKAMALAIRASALSGGETQPIKNYVNSYPQPSFADGQPNLRTIHTKYVLSSVMDKLGDSMSGVGSWEQIVRDVSPTPERTIAYLDSRAQQIVNEMRRIERDVIGQSTIAGDDDE